MPFLLPGLNPFLALPAPSGSPSPSLPCSPQRRRLPALFWAPSPHHNLTVCWWVFTDSCTPNQPGTHQSRSFWSQSRCRSPRWWSPDGPGRRRGCPALSGSQSGLAPHLFPVTPTPGHTGRAPELRPSLPAHCATSPRPGTSSPPPHSLLLLRVGVPLPLPSPHLLSLGTGAQTGRALPLGGFVSSVQCPEYIRIGHQH